MSNAEQRIYVGAKIWTGRAATSNERKLEGYAAMFNTYSQDLGGFREKIKPGAFKNALKEGQDVRFLVNHSPDSVMGRTKNGTLSLREDDKGLKFSVSLPDTQAARDLYTTVQSGLMDQCSFSFKVRDGGDTWGQDFEIDPDDRSKKVYFAAREVSDVDLFDVSAVTYPAYTNTKVEALDVSSIRELIPAEVRSVVEALNARRVVAPAINPDVLSAVDEDCNAYIRSILS
jgi:uncharacterized protein